MNAIGIPRCKECQGQLPTPKATGRPRDYCSDRCKRRTKRRRQHVTAWPPAPPAYGPPLDKATIDRRTADAIVRALEGKTQAPAEDQLAQALLEAGVLAYCFEALERSLPTNLAGPSGELGRRLRQAMGALFPTLGEDLQ